jgi:hypothetical protein
MQLPEPSTQLIPVPKPVSALSGGGRSSTPSTRKRSNSCSFKVGETIREAVKNPVSTTIYPRWESISAEKMLHPRIEIGSNKWENYFHDSTAV